MSKGVCNVFESVVKYNTFELQASENGKLKTKV